jgi:hypothetical protein
LGEPSKISITVCLFVELMALRIYGNKYKYGVKKAKKKQSAHRLLLWRLPL